MNANLPVGTRVVRVEAYFKRYGNVVETGAARLRIKWDYTECRDGRVILDGKRTWMRADRVSVVPQEIG